MAFFSRIVGGIRGLLRKHRAEQDLDDELRAYLETAIEEKMASGMSREAAVRAARVAVGSVEAVKDRVRDVGWESVVEGIWQDVRFALRMLRKQPAFTAAAVATLALGIGGTTAIFSVVDALFLRAPDGIADPSSVRRLYIKRDSGTMTTPTGGRGSWTDYSAMRQSGAAIAGIAAYLRPELVDVGRGSEAEQVSADVISYEFLQVLGIRPARGRLFVADDDGVPGAHPVAIVSHAMWQSKLGGTEDVIGRTLLVNGVPLEIVGVTQKHFTGIESTAVDLWLPASMAGPLSLARNDRDWRNIGGIFASYVVRVAPGAEASTAERQAADALRGAATSELDPTPEVLSTSLVLASRLRPTMVSDVSLWLALVAGLVLVIASANVANLLLARAISRRRELAVRLSLGAGAWRVMRQHLTESAVLALLGGGAGVVIAYWAMGLMRQFPPPPSVGRIDTRLLLFALALSLVTSVLFGILPAIRAVQLDPVQALKESRASGALVRSRTRLGLIVLQISLSLTLLVGAGLFVRSLQHVYLVRSGVDVNHALIARVDLRRARYTPEDQQAFYESALSRLATVGVVEHAGLIHLEPFSGGTPIAFWAMPGESKPRQKIAVLAVASHGYFEAAGTRLLRGRTFEATDRPGGEPVAVVNEAMAKLIATEADPLGLCIPFDRQVRRGGCTRIVGIVESERRFYLVDEPQPRVFLAWAQSPNVVPFGIPSLIVKTRNHASDASMVRSALQGLRSDLPFVSVEPLTERLSSDLMPFRLGATLFSLFGALALVLAAVGLYGVLGYFVTERTTEIGIRRSLGAPAGNVVRLIVQQGMTPVGVGLVLGLVVAFASTRYLGSLLFGIKAHDPVSFVSGASFVVCVAIVATLIPAWRATQIDPIVALRQE